MSVRTSKTGSADPAVFAPIFPHTTKLIIFMIKVHYFTNFLTVNSYMYFKADLQLEA